MKCSKYRRSSFIEGFGIPDKLQLSGLPSRPGAIESRISREIPGRGSIKITESVEQLKNDLEKINTLVKNAGRLILRFGHASDIEHRDILAELDHIDSQIMEGNCNVILSFLLQDEISEVKADSGGDNPIEKSQKLYQSIRRTAEIYLSCIKRFFY